MFFAEAEPEYYIFQQNDPGSCFFIIDKGTCQVIINEESRRKLGPGDGFGDLALLYNSPRTGSIKANEKVGLWALDRNTFRCAIEEISIKDYEINRSFINDIKFFSMM